MGDGPVCGYCQLPLLDGECGCDEGTEIATLRAALEGTLAALRLIEPKDKWKGWENWHGEEIGERIEAAVIKARRALGGGT